MAGKTHFATLVLAAVVTAAALVGTTAATVYVVGDSLGWQVPSGGAATYSSWAAKHTFVTGDILVFNFLTGQHDLARVTKDAFDGCNSTSPIYLHTTGPANFTLDATGEYYFICTFGTHCANGQKLALNVSSTSGGRPTTEAATYVVGDSLGWTEPSGGAATYSSWAAKHTFVTGDILVFNFLTGQHDLARVTKDAFDGCNPANPIYLQTVGPANYTLNATGEYYFICTFGQHCANGQKLALNVSSTSGGSPTPSPSPPAPSPSSPSPAPTPTPSGTPPPSPTPAPTPSGTPPPSPTPATPPPSPSPASSPPPPPATATPPSSSPPPGSNSPPSETNSPPPPPPPPSSDASKAVAGFGITVMSIAMVALF